MWVTFWHFMVVTSQVTARNLMLVVVLLEGFVLLSIQYCLTTRIYLSTRCFLRNNVVLQRIISERNIVMPSRLSKTTFSRHLNTATALKSVKITQIPGQFNHKSILCRNVGSSFNRKFNPQKVKIKFKLAIP